MVAAAIGGALALGGAYLSSKAQKKAANTAATTAQNTADQNNALTRDIYNQNRQTLSPFVNTGVAASNQINSLLGLGGAANQNQTYSPQPMPQQQVQFDPSVQGGYNPAAYGDASGFGGSIPMANAPAQFYSGQQPPQGMGQTLPQGMGQTLSPMQSPQQAQNSAFDVFRNSTGYQFRLGEGMNALNSGYAGAGVLQSGAAMRGAQEYGQNFASNEFGNYMNALQNQQGVGLAGGSALAGVGQNYAGMVSQNNNAAGTATANAALVRGANNPFASALGTLGGTILSGGIKF